MNKKISRSIILYALLGSISLSGCGEKSNCEIPTSHVHLYTKDITNEISIHKYLNDEHLKNFGFTWHEDYIEVTKDDEDVFKLLNSKNLFNGADNWDYLYYLMSNTHDYLEFYYYYTTTETYITVDEDGDTQVHTREVEHSGWTTNPYNTDNTGRVRLNHHRYFGYNIIRVNGKFKLQKSDEVDDVREILQDYPYVMEDCRIVVYKEFTFSKHELGNLSPNDFNVFANPDLSNNSVNLGRQYIKN